MHNIEKLSLDLSKKIPPYRNIPSHRRCHEGYYGIQVLGKINQFRPREMDQKSRALADLWRI